MNKKTLKKQVRLGQQLTQDIYRLIEAAQDEGAYLSTVLTSLTEAICAVALDGLEITNAEQIEAFNDIQSEAAYDIFKDFMRYRAMDLH